MPRKIKRPDIGDSRKRRLVGRKGAAVGAKAMNEQKWRSDSPGMMETDIEGGRESGQSQLQTDAQTIADWRFTASRARANPTVVVTFTYT